MNTENLKLKNTKRKSCHLRDRIFALVRVARLELAALPRWRDGKAVRRMAPSPRRFAATGEGCQQEAAVLPAVPIKYIPPPKKGRDIFGPSGETRTRDLLLPKQAPYQLGYTRKCTWHYSTLAGRWQVFSLAGGVDVFSRLWYDRAGV